MSDLKIALEGRVLIIDNGVETELDPELVLQALLVIIQEGAEALLLKHKQKEGLKELTEITEEFGGYDGEKVP